MSEEETTQTKEEVKTTNPKVPEVDFDALRNEIDSASKTMVSEEVRKTLEAEREAIRKQAKVDAERDSYLKEKEAEIARLKKESEEREKRTAEQLDSFKKKLDELSASKQIAPQDNPFKGRQSPENRGFDAKKLDTDDFEKESFYALMSRRPPKD